MKIFIILFSLFSACYSLGQQVTGIITDKTNKPIPNLELVIYTDKGDLEQVTMTDQAGAYSILLTKEGTFQLSIYNAGDLLLTKQIIVAGNLVENITIEKEITLEGVTITAIRPLIVNKIDRLVFNVEQSIVSNGTDALTVLAKTPLVIVGENGISIVGKSGVSIMIDDRILNIGGPDLLNYLKSIRSDDIARIEVITAPPAKYQAEGNSGIINIVLKKNPKMGWNGSVSAAYQQTTYFGISDNASLTYRSKKISTALRLRHFDRSMKATEDIQILGNSSVLSYDERKDRFSGLGGNFSFDYQWTEKIHSGVIYDIGKINSTMFIYNTTSYKTGNILDSTLVTTSDHTNPALSQTLNIYTDIAIDTTGESLSFVGNYFSNLPNTTVNFETSSNETLLLEKVRNTSAIDYAIWSVQTDYYKPTKWIQFETGAKYTNFINKSDVSYLNSINDTYTIDPTKSNKFEYYEQNMAGYVSISKKFKKKWDSKAGLRYEYSTIEGYSPTTGERTRYEYGKLFPTAYLSYEANTKNYFSINYSKRVNRPSFNTLNPFRWYANPYTYFTGNPLLRPSFNHTIELSYGYNGMLTVSLYGQKQINGFGRTVELINAVEKVVNYDNYLTLHSVGINASLFLNITKWWGSYLSANATYSESKSTNPTIIAQNGFSTYYSIDNTITIHSEKKVKAMINFWHALPARQGNSFSDHISGLSLGMRFPFIKNRFQANILFNDVLKGSVSRGVLYFNDFEQTYKNYYDSRNFTISITYTFGNKNVQENKKNIDFDEKYRGN